MGDLRDNVFLRAAFVRKIAIPTTSSTFTSSMSVVESSTRRSKEKPLQTKPNAAHRKYSKLEDQLILKAVEPKGHDWRAVLAFLKKNWEVLREEGEAATSATRDFTTA